MVSSLRLNLRGTVDKANSVDALDRNSDVSLVRAARDGDYAAFERLFDRHRDLVYRFAYQMLRRRDDAEDMTQEVFVRAYQNLHRYRDEAKFTTWLLRIATNYGTDRIRMSKRRQNLEQQEAAGALTWMTTERPDSPIANLEMERKREFVRNAIDALPEHHKSMIVMRDIEEMSYDDISRIVGCTVGGAKLRVLRARRALRDRVAPVFKEEFSE